MTAMPIIGFDQFDQVALRGDLVTAIDVDAVLAQRAAETLGVLAIIARQQLLGAQILEVDAVAARRGDAALLTTS